jgi:hypothetical protein
VDGVLYEGKIHSIAAPPGTGKTMLALHLCSGVMRGGRRVLYLDAENGPSLVAGRLEDLGADPDLLDDLFVYHQEEPSLREEDLDALFATVEEARPALVVFDSLADFVVAAGLEENSNTDLTRWMAAVAQPLKEAGCAVLLLDHVPKGAKGPRGAGAKVAKVDVQWNLEATQPFDRERTGEVVLTRDKDREAWLPQRVKFSVGGGVFARSAGTVPGTSADPGEDPEATLLSPGARKVLDALRGAGEEGATWSGLRAAVGGSKSSTSRSLKELARNRLWNQRGKRYYAAGVEPENPMGTPDEEGSKRFQEGSVEPSEPGDTEGVPRVPTPYRGWNPGTPDARNPERDHPEGEEARVESVAEVFRLAAERATVPEADREPPVAAPRARSRDPLVHRDTAKTRFLPGKLMRARA